MKKSRSCVAVVLFVLLVRAAAGQGTRELRVYGPRLDAGAVLSLADLGKSAVQGTQRYELVRKAMFGEANLERSEVLAFEENQSFTFAAGVFHGKIPRQVPGGVRVESFEWVRRFLLLKPGCLVVDDQVRMQTPLLRVGWVLCSSEKAERIGDRRFRVRDRAGQVTLETLLPRDVEGHALAGLPGTQPGSHALAVASKEASAVTRFLHLVRIKGGEEAQGEAVKLHAKDDGLLELDVGVGDRTFRLTLPPPDAGAGDIAIQKADGTNLLQQRPLASGILPHTPEGLKLLEQWDSAYRGGKRPGWDTGRPSSHLAQAVESGKIKPCRTLELGCGLGTNAIYLAGRKFDVSALDIAPSALSGAMERAKKANVSVQWVLADVLAPPKIGPFDFIYDRGCYHGVRRGNAAGYIETLRKLTRPGSLVLIEAGNANEPPPHYGPPRVKEEELRADFSADFDFQELRETHFNTSDPNGKGALSWFVLLRRKDKP